MAGTISFGGIGSGLDVEGIVTGLVQASKGSLNAINSRAATAASASSSISELSSLLSRFQSAVSALDDATETKSNTVTSSSSSIVASATGAAQAGSYGVKVLGLATEARVYSNTFTSTGGALGQAGSLELGIGETSATIEITAEDSLNSIVGKINDAGLRVSATTFYDGTSHRLLLNGLDKGSDSALSIVETGFDFGLNVASNIKQTAANARVEVDGFLVESQSNQVMGAIPGVTLAVTKTTAEQETITVATDPGALQAKMQAVVDTFNTVINKVHTLSGFGGTKASNSLLAGDSTLRNLTSRMSNAVMTRVDTGTKYESLASIGMNLGRDGTLSFDAIKFKEAFTADPSSVGQVLAGSGSTDGIMDVFRDLSKSLTTSGTGLLSTKVETIDAQVKALKERATSEQERLDRYAEQLRSQFLGIEDSVSSSYADLDYLAALYAKK